MYLFYLIKVSVQAFSDEDPQGRRTLGNFVNCSLHNFCTGNPYVLLETLLSAGILRSFSSSAEG